MNRRTALIWLLGLAILVGTAPAGADVIYSVDDGAQEIGGTTPTITGSPGNIVATGSHAANPTPSNFTYTWSGFDVVELNGSPLTYTRREDGDTRYGRGTLTFDMGGASIDGATGLITVTPVRHESGTGTNNLRRFSTEHVSIVNVGDIELGGIDTHDPSTSLTHQTANGSITIGASGAETGNVLVGYLWTYNTNVNGDYSAQAGNGGSVTIWSAGNVLIKDSSNVAGDILTYSVRQAGSGAVEINHTGDFQAGIIGTWLVGGGSSSGTSGGKVTLTGGLNSENSLGTLVVASIITGDLSQRSNHLNTTEGARPSVTISNYSDVEIGDLDTHSVLQGTNRRLAGNVSISDITGNIDITGSINLQAEYFNGTNNDSGSLTLAAGGAVTLASLDMGKVLYAYLSSGAGASSILGELANFDPDASGGDGSLANPFLTSQDSLRTPDGQVIYYDPAAAGNEYLGGFTYRIADLSGSASAGGYLTPVTAAVPEPATLSLLVLGALAGLVARRRRSSRG